MGLVLVHGRSERLPAFSIRVLNFLAVETGISLSWSPRNTMAAERPCECCAWGNFFPSVLDPIVTVALGAIVVDGVEQDKGIGFGGDRCILTVLFEAGNRPGRRGRGHRPNRRPQPIFSGRSQAFGHFSNPAYGRLPVLDAFEGGCLACFLPCSPQSSRPFPSRPGIHSGGQIERVAAGPTAAKEEDDGRPFVFGRYGLWDRKR